MTGRLADLTRWLGHPGERPRNRVATRRITSKGVPVDIRAGAAADIPALAPMIERTCALHRGWDVAKFGFVANAVPMYSRWLARQASDPRSVFVVAAAGRHLAAFAIGTSENAAPVFAPAIYGLIRDFWVEEDWRRSGIGCALLHATIDRFHAIGIVQIRLETAAANDTARRFFAGNGFRSSAIEMLIE